MRKINGQYVDVQKYLEEHDLRYRDIDFFHNPVIGKEVVRFKWNSPKYRGHKYRYQGVVYFDDFIMNELKRIAEINEVKREEGATAWTNLKS